MTFAEFKKKWSRAQGKEMPALRHWLTQAGRLTGRAVTLIQAVRPLTL